MCIAYDTKWLFFRIVPPPSAGEQYTTKLELNNKVCRQLCLHTFYLLFLSR